MGEWRARSEAGRVVDEAVMGRYVRECISNIIHSFFCILAFYLSYSLHCPPHRLANPYPPLLILENRRSGRRVTVANPAHARFERLLRERERGLAAEAEAEAEVEEDVEVEEAEVAYGPLARRYMNYGGESEGRGDDMGKGKAEGAGVGAEDEMKWDRRGREGEAGGGGRGAGKSNDSMSQGKRE
jgi:hypothetical protein